MYSSKQPRQDAHQQWQAAVQQAVTTPQLALQVRALAGAIQWDALKTPTNLGDSKWGRAELLSRRKDHSGRGWEYQLRIRSLVPPPPLPPVLPQSAAPGPSTLPANTSLISTLMSSLIPTVAPTNPTIPPAPTVPATAPAPAEAQQQPAALVEEANTAAAPAAAVTAQPAAGKGEAANGRATADRQAAGQAQHKQALADDIDLPAQNGHLEHRSGQPESAAGDPAADAGNGHAPDTKMTAVNGGEQHTGRQLEHREGSPVTQDALSALMADAGPSKVQPVGGSAAEPAGGQAEDHAGSRSGAAAEDEQLPRPEHAEGAPPPPALPAAAPEVTPGPEEPRQSSPAASQIQSDRAASGEALPAGAGQQPSSRQQSPSSQPPATVLLEVHEPDTPGAEAWVSVRITAADSGIGQDRPRSASGSIAEDMPAVMDARFVHYRWVPPGGMPAVPATILAGDEAFWPDLPEDEQRYSGQPAAQAVMLPLPSPLPLKRTGPPNAFAKASGKVLQPLRGLSASPASRA